ncbi:MAG: AraC family transcriptional regulator [Bacillus sp. (in: Bacteria)]|nr:AraC family transcriptional regulator [Bacillus sp. (in: firmicutes)]MCM1425685.1 AraC family transcriptional regulator [Eubacterium sp.]
MPLPLKAGYNFNYSHIHRPPCFEMTAAEAYTDFYGLSYLISGDALIYSPDGTSIIHEGDMHFTLKNIYFRSSYLSDKPREFVLIKFTDSMIDDLLKAMEADSLEELIGSRPAFHLSKPTQKKVLCILQEMEEEWNSNHKYAEIIFKGLLHKLILIFINERAESPCETAADHRKQTYLINAIEYVQSHLSESPSLHHTAKHINISASYLSKIFINQLHTPYSTFLLNEKILYAQKLLVNTKMSMSDIASAAGFSSNAYFSDCFKRRMGISPMQFRKRM